MSAQTIEQLTAQVAQLTAELAAAREDGAKAERARIQGVESAVLPGHEALVAGLKFDGKTTAGDAALLVMSAERKRLNLESKALSDDAPAPVKTAATPPVDPPEKTKQKKADEIMALAKAKNIDPLLAMRELGYA